MDRCYWMKIRRKGKCWTIGKRKSWRLRFWERNWCMKGMSTILRIRLIGNIWRRLRPFGLIGSSTPWQSSPVSDLSKSNFPTLSSSTSRLSNRSCKAIWLSALTIISELWKSLLWIMCYLMRIKEKDWVLRWGSRGCSIGEVYRIGNKWYRMRLGKRIKRIRSFWLVSWCCAHRPHGQSCTCGKTNSNRAADCYNCHKKATPALPSTSSKPHNNL